MEPRGNAMPKDRVLLTENLDGPRSLSDGMMNLVYLDRVFNTIELQHVTAILSGRITVESSTCPCNRMSSKFLISNNLS